MSKVGFRLLLLALGCIAAVPLQGQNAYFTSGSGVVVLDTTTNTVVTTITGVQNLSGGVAVSPDGKRVYLATAPNYISVIDATTNTFISTISVGNEPFGVAVSADSSKVYVSNSADGTVSVIDTLSNTNTATITLPYIYGSYPLGIVVSPNGATVYVSVQSSTTGAAYPAIDAIDTSSMKVTELGPPNLNQESVQLAVAPGGGIVYGAGTPNSGSNPGAVSGFNVLTNQPVTSIPLMSGGEAVAISQDGLTLYATDGGYVYVISTATNSIITTIPPGTSQGAFGISLTPDGKSLYVVDRYGYVRVINTTTLATTYEGVAPLEYNATAFGVFIRPPSASAPPPPPSCTIVSQTLAHVPGTDDNQRAVKGRIGVGENVSLKLTSGQNADWKIISGGGPLTPEIAAATGFLPNEGFPTKQCSGSQASEVNGAQACFVAPDENDSTIVRATLPDGESCSVKLTTVQPQGLIFQRLQTPRKPEISPDYSFLTSSFGLSYDITMESVVFITPGDVSFANTIFKEKDVDDPNFHTRYNALFNIGGTSAWLEGCDYDHQKGERYFDHVYQKDDTWAFAVYANRQVGTEVDFSRVKTAWSVTHPVNNRDRTAEFSKRQVEALSANGIFIDAPVPDSQASILRRPAIEFDDFVFITDHATCLRDVKEQFEPASAQ